MVTYQAPYQIDDPAITDHGVAVTSVIAAANNRANNPSSSSPLSGVVSSIPRLHYNLHMFAAGNRSSKLPRENTATTLRIIADFERVEEYAIDVVNMSFGGPKKDNDKRRDLARGMRGVTTFVTSAGNCEQDASDKSPANWSLDMPNVITVGGTNRAHTDRWRVSGTRENCIDDIGGSAFGPPISVAAPAERVLVVKPKMLKPAGYSTSNGTSYAAPMVTGTVALLKAISPDLEPSEMRQLLRDSADMTWVCASNNDISSCPAGEREEWPFLRADKAVHELLKRLVKAEIVKPPPPLALTGPNVISNDFEATVLNAGERTWTFYTEAWARSPSGDATSLGAVETAIPAGKAHLIRWRFSRSTLGLGVSDPEPGEWDLRIVVRRDDINDPDMDRALSDDRVLDTLHWGEAKIKVLPVPPPTPTPTPTAVAAPPAVSVTPAPTAGALPASSVTPSPTAGAPPAASTPPPSPQGGAIQQDFNVLLLADTSGSMEGDKIEALRESVIQFIEGVDGTGDEFVGLIDFDTGFRQAIPLAPFGGDTGAWRAAVETLDGDGGTAFYDAVINAVSVLESDGAPGRINIIIALTDGMDQDSAASIDDAIQALLAHSPAPVYLHALAYGEAGDYDLGALERLAEATGGLAFTANPTDVDRLFKVLAWRF